MFKTSVAKTKFTNTCFTVWILLAPRHGPNGFKDETGSQELVKAFQSILSSRRKSSKLQTDPDIPRDNIKHRFLLREVKA